MPDSREHKVVRDLLDKQAVGNPKGQSLETSPSKTLIIPEFY